jgi:serine/threonine protein kinase
MGGTQYTVDGTLMGTLEYMAPEQGLKGICDARSDIYSLGVVFYEMLAQQVPFEADTPLAILMKHVNDPLLPPRRADPTIPRSLERIVLKSLAKKPDQRYHNANAMSEALRTACKRARIEIPERIGLPLSFTTIDNPSESVAVISGDTRSKLTDSDFAGGETDISLQNRINADHISEHQVRNEIADTPSTEIQENNEANADRNIRPKHQVVKTILGALGLVTAGNLIIILISGIFNNWSAFSIGWPMELFLISAGLFFIMAWSRNIYFFIPAGILFSNGIIMAYSSLTGNWQHWSFLWILELWAIAATIITAITLAKQPHNAQKVSRVLGWSLCVTSLVTAILTAGSSMAYGVIQRLSNT